MYLIFGLFIIIPIVTHIIFLFIILIFKVILIQFLFKLLKLQCLTSEPIDRTRNEFFFDILSKLIVELKALLKTTDGNLSAHCRKLEDAEYVVCTKSFEGRRPRTEYRLAHVGRRKLGRYLDHMEAIIKATRGG